MDNLKKIILQKKELKGLNEEFLDEFLVELKKKNPKLFRVLEEKNYNEKSKEFDEVKKEIRKKIRGVHGVFAKKPLSSDKKIKLLRELQKAQEENDLKQKEKLILEILESHQSTFERKNIYKALYTKIFENEALEKVQKIVDLGCGYNPFSYMLLEFKPAYKQEYYAVDINKEDEKFINDFFHAMKINGKCETLDLTDEKNLDIIRKETSGSDICFMFKLLDSLEAKMRGSSAKLIKNTLSEQILISFPLKTIGGRNEIKGKRNWFTRILKDQNLDSDEFIIENEQFYILRRK
jgi:16S rRNA (guanine(1405)-N(7))-methyltransferase